MKDLSYVQSLNAHTLDYNLPDERIAKYPLKERDLSKLLVCKSGEIHDAQFKQVANFLPNDSLLVFNNTKVIRARLHFKKSTGANIQIFCLDPIDPADYQVAFQQTKSCVWNCMVGNLKKWKNEDLCLTLKIGETEVKFTAQMLSRNETSVQVRFLWDNDQFDFGSLIEACGELPIPPYLHRDTEEEDLERYQTVYSKEKGSVAAPTAGLHFTDEIFSTLEQKNIRRAELTLHVGAGTFKPVQSETIGEHDMHAEQVIVSKTMVDKLIANKGKLVAVGTTSIRSLESLYWLGVKLHNNPQLQTSDFDISQWMPYEEDCHISKQESLEAILAYMEREGADFVAFYTKIIIVPSYEFRIVEGMITNFHQPQSTLLLLISAFIGEDWKRVYQHALDNNYRFLSYGDSNLYLKG